MSAMDLDLTTECMTFPKLFLGHTEVMDGWIISFEVKAKQKK